MVKKIMGTANNMAADNEFDDLELTLIAGVIRGIT